MVETGEKTRAFSRVLRAESRHRTLLLFLVGAFAALQLVRVSADSPVFLSRDIGIFIDEGFKTLDARNMVLYGKTHWTDEDEYSGWLLGSPFTVLPNFAVFKVFGVSLSNARTLGTCFAVGVLMILFAFTRITYGGRLALLCVLLLATNHIFFFHGRTALFEVKALFFMVSTLYFMKKARRDPVFFALVILSCTAVYFCKRTMITFVLAVGVYYVLTAWRGALLRRLTRPLVAALLLIATLGTAYFLEFHSDLFKGATVVGRDLRGPLTALTAWATPTFFKKIPVLSWLALLYVGFVFARLMFERTYRNADILFSVWLITGILVHSFFDYRPLRYHMVFLVPIVVLAARGMLALPEILGAAIEGRGKWVMRAVILLSVIWLALFAIWSLLSSFSFLRPVLDLLSGHAPALAVGSALVLVTIGLYGCRRRESILRVLRNRHEAICVVLTVLIVVTHLIPIAAWMRAPQYELASLSGGLRSLGEEVIVVGQWAPQLCVDTTCKTLYSDLFLGGKGKDPHTMNLENLESIRPDFVVFVDGVSDAYRNEFERLYPGVVQEEPTLEGPYGGRMVCVHGLRFGSPL
jgi:hypothetical protein